MNSNLDKRLLINASNLHGGGAVAVATSFINEISKDIENASNISIIASTLVNDNLLSHGVKINVFKSYKVRNYFGISAVWRGLTKEFNDYDIIFTIFGPAYFLFSRKKHVVGFAQPWILYPNNPIAKNLPYFSQLKLRSKYKLQSLFFSQADELIVELEHVKKGLEKYSYLKNIPTHIVNSSVDEIFFAPEKWKALNELIVCENLKLGIIAKNYPHKNLNCLPEVQHLLFENYGLEVDFFVTFQEKEWLGCSKKFRSVIYNVGTLTLNQCPSFYTEMDGVIFPSLLECFSATPIEAMTMKKPLFASDLPFIRDCCDDYAFYFDPMNSDDIANVIADYFLNMKTSNDALLENAKKHAEKYSSAKNRADGYMRIIQGIL
jgi:glycosyltransferase involved in cell wall biosynthesis